MSPGPACGLSLFRSLDAVRPTVRARVWMPAQDDVSQPDAELMTGSRRCAAGPQPHRRLRRRSNRPVRPGCPNGFWRAGHPRQGRPRRRFRRRPDRRSTSRRPGRPRLRAHTFDRLTPDTSFRPVTGNPLEDNGNSVCSKFVGVASRVFWPCGAGAFVIKTPRGRSFCPCIRLRLRRRCGSWRTMR